MRCKNPITTQRQGAMEPNVVQLVIISEAILEFVIDYSEVFSLFVLLLHVKPNNQLISLGYTQNMRFVASESRPSTIHTSSVLEHVDYLFPQTVSYKTSRAQPWHYWWLFIMTWCASLKLVATTERLLLGLHAVMSSPLNEITSTSITSGSPWDCWFVGYLRGSP